MKALYIVLYVILGLVGAVWLFGRLGGEQRQIERRLEQVAEILEKDADEGNLAAVRKAHALGDVLEKHFRLDLGPFGGVLDDQAELARVVLGYRQRAESIDIAFRNFELLGPIQSSQAGATVIAVVGSKSASGRARESYRLRIEWSSESGDWRIHELRLLEVLEGTLGF